MMLRRFLFCSRPCCFNGFHLTEDPLAEKERLQRLARNGFIIEARFNSRYGKGAHAKNHLTKELDDSFLARTVL